MARKPDVQYIHFVTDGSAARKAEIARPKPRTRLPKVKKKQEVGVIRIDLLACVGVLLSAVMLVLMVVSCFQLADYQSKANAMDDYVDHLKSENNRLNAQYEEVVDLGAIEDMALSMGLVPVEEVRHLSVSVEHTPEEAPVAAPFTSLLADLFR